MRTGICIHTNVLAAVAYALALALAFALALALAVAVAVAVVFAYAVAIVASVIFDLAKQPRRRLFAFAFVILNGVALL